MRRSRQLTQTPTPRDVTHRDISTSHDLVLMEPLETRAMCYAGPMTSDLPEFSQLTNQGNTVLRLSTSLGAIDIELFDTVVQCLPAIVHFRQYVTSGRIDETFFHSLVPDKQLVGGLFRYADGQGHQNVSVLDTLPNQFTRANLARTVALMPSVPSGSTSAFVINLDDNRAQDTAGGGYAVFGRVCKGWNVVQAINALARTNLSPTLLPSDPTNAVFSSVPVGVSYDPMAGPSEQTLVRVHDAEFIKLASTRGFLQHAASYPEWKRGDQTIEFLHLGSVTETATDVQVIARYRSGDRDSVIWSGTIGPIGRITLPISHYLVPANQTVRSDEEYTIEVRSTHLITASSQRRLGDTARSLVEESFFSPGSQNLTSSPLTVWHFTGLTKGDTQRPTLSWADLSGTFGTVTVLVYPEAGGAVSAFPFSIKPFATGGIPLDVWTAALAPGTRYAVQVRATAPIIAAATNIVLDTPAGAVAAASGTLGVIATGRPRGFLAAGRVLTGQGAWIDFFASSPAVVSNQITVSFHLNSGTVLTIAPGSLRFTPTDRVLRLDLTTVASLPRDEFFSVSYSVAGGVNAAAVYTAEAAGDLMSTPFTYAMTWRQGFADGWYNPSITPAGTIDEVVSIFNPFTRLDGEIIYQVAFRFVDNTQIFVPASIGTLAPQRRVDVRTRDIPEVMAKINSDVRFRAYSIEVFGLAFTTAINVDGLVAQVTRVWNHLGLAQTTLGQLYDQGRFTFVNNPALN